MGEKIISVVGILCGVALVIIGISALVFYFKGAIDDFSLAYWLLIILFLGVLLIIMGLGLVTLGALSLKGNIVAYKILKISLVLVGVFLLIFAFWFKGQMISLEKAYEIGDEMKIQSNYLRENIYKITRLEISGNDNKGFTYEYVLTGNLKGEYLLKTLIKDSYGSFIEKEEIINLEGGDKIFEELVEYEYLFHKCFVETDKSTSYICVDNTGSTATVDLILELELIEDSENLLLGLESNLLIPELKQIQFTVDTFRKNGHVEVRSFEA